MRKEWERICDEDSVKGDGKAERRRRKDRAELKKKAFRDLTGRLNQRKERQGERREENRWRD